MNTDKPEISVIVPIYKVEKYVRKCIESIINQTLRNIEIILVDDGSPDKCGEICDEYASTDSRIKVIHGSNRGVSAARNAGIELASADVIGFVDGDDWIEPQMYEKLLDAMHRTSADIGVCNLTYDFKNFVRTENPAICKETVVGRDEALEMLVFENLLHSYPCDKVFKRDVITTRFPENCRYEDLRVMVRWVAKKVVLVPYSGYHYIQRNGSYLHAFTIERCVSRIKAILCQFDFLKAEGLISGCWERFQIHLIREALLATKYMARSLPVDKALHDGLEEMARLISPYTDGKMQLLSPKDCRRLLRLMHHRRCYVVTMRLSNLFHKLKPKGQLAECFD